MMNPPRHLQPILAAVVVCLAPWQTTLAEEPRPRAVLSQEGVAGKVNAIAFAKDGKTLAVAGDDGQVRLWDAAAAKRTATLRGHKEGVWSLAFSPDGKRLAAGTYFRRLAVWDVESRRVLFRVVSHRARDVWSVAFSPDGKTIACGCSWGSPGEETVILCDAATGKVKAALKGHTSSVHSVAFSPDGKLLASGGTDKAVMLWEPSTAERLATLRGHTSFIQAVAFSPDGKSLASGESDGTARVWDVAVLAQAKK